MLRALMGLRLRLVVTFTLVAVVATVTTGALTFREARTGVLQQSQDTVIEEFRHRVDTLVPNYRFPPDAAGLESFADDVSIGAVGHSRGRCWSPTGRRARRPVPGTPSRNCPRRDGTGVRPAAAEHWGVSATRPSTNWPAPSPSPGCARTRHWGARR
ncbi:hypothetical protein SVIOM342S_01270 [Streptomyces violaceorubidus]